MPKCSRELLWEIFPFVNDLIKAALRAHSRILFAMRCFLFWCLILSLGFRRYLRQGPSTSPCVSEEWGDHDIPSDQRYPLRFEPQKSCIFIIPLSFWILFSSHLSPITSPFSIFSSHHRSRRSSLILVCVASLSME